MDEVHQLFELVRLKIGRSLCIDITCKEFSVLHTAKLIIQEPNLFTIIKNFTIEWFGLLELCIGKRSANHGALRNDCTSVWQAEWNGMQSNGMRLNGAREPLRVERRWKPKEGPGRGTRATYVGNTRAWRSFWNSKKGLKTCVWNAGNVGTEKTAWTLMTYNKPKIELRITVLCDWRYGRNTALAENFSKTVTSPQPERFSRRA